MAAQDNNESIQELRHILGDINEITAAQILALEPTQQELEIALLWAEGKEDIVATRGGTLSGKTSQIYDILTTGEGKDGPPPRA